MSPTKINWISKKVSEKGKASGSWRQEIYLSDGTVERKFYTGPLQEKIAPLRWIPFSQDRVGIVLSGLPSGDFRTAEVISVNLKPFADDPAKK